MKPKTLFLLLWVALILIQYWNLLDICVNHGYHGVTIIDGRVACTKAVKNTNYGYFIYLAEFLSSLDNPQGGPPDITPVPPKDWNSRNL